MTKAHLTQLWQWLSIACVLFLTTSIISLQGGTEFVGRLFGDKGSIGPDNNPAVGYFGAIIGGGLFLVASLAFLLHARRHGERWHSRVPVVWLEGLDTSAWEAKLFQVCVVLIFVALPAVGIIRCISEAESGDICEQDTKNVYKGSETTLLWPPVAKDGKQMRLRKAGSGDAPCLSGVELFPRSLTPVAFYGLPIAAGAVGTAAVISLFWRRRPKSPGVSSQTTNAEFT